MCEHRDCKARWIPVKWIWVPSGCALQFVPRATEAEIARWDVKAEEWMPGVSSDCNLFATSGAGGRSSMPNVQDTQFIATDGGCQPNVASTEPTNVVVLWPLGPLWNDSMEVAYTKDELWNDLVHIDFEPSKIVMCVKGKAFAFGISFSLPYLAEAIVVALDGHPKPGEIFKRLSMDGDIVVRLAFWRGGIGDPDPDIPDFVHEILAEQEWPETQLHNREAYQSTEWPG